MWLFPFTSFYLLFLIFDCMFHTSSDQTLVSSGWNYWFQKFQWAGFTDICLIFELIVTVCITGVHMYTESQLFQHGRQRETHLLSTRPQSFAFGSLLFLQKQPKCVIMYFWSLASSLRSFWPSGVCPLRQQTRSTQRAVN